MGRHHFFAMFCLACAAVLLTGLAADSCLGAPKPGDLEKRFEQFLRTLYTFQSPETALASIDQFEANHELTASQRQRLQTQRERFQEVARKGLKRLGTQWVAIEEFNAAVSQCEAEIDRARECLKAGDGKGMLRHLEKASQLNPNAIEPDFLLGMLFSIKGNCNPIVAEKHFQSALVYNPDYVPALNNLALTEVKLRKFDEAYAHWKQVARINAKNPELIQNLGRVVREGRTGALPVPNAKQPGRKGKTRYELFVELYQEVCQLAGVSESNSGVGQGWYYAPLVKTAAERDLEPPGIADPPPPPIPAEQLARNVAAPLAGRLVPLFSGTGFAVTPSLVLTNRHVVCDDALGVADSVTVQAFAGENTPRFTGRVRAVSEHADLALIEVPNLGAQPIGLSSRPIERGTDAAIFGYPYGAKLGASLKMTRGIVSALPDQNWDGKFMLDAEANPGNSGGPVVDLRGQVIGVVTAIVLPDIGDYSLAIPSSIAANFVGEGDVPFVLAPPQEPETSWKEVDKAVSGSVYLLEALYRASPLRLTESLPPQMKPAKPVRHELEDVSCCSCNGLGVQRCNARGCALGAVTQTDWYSTFTVDLGVYGSVKHAGTTTRKERCTVCDGKGYLTCNACRGTGRGSDIR